MKFAVLIFVLLLPFASQSRAEEGDAPKGKAAKKVLVTFDEDLVQGSMTGAELFLILQKKETKFEHLFEMKDDFTPEMEKDADNIK